MRKKKAPRPAVWVATFKGTWFLKSDGSIASRAKHSTVRAFTVAADKEEAILTMHNGLLQFDGIGFPGKAQDVRRLKLKELGAIPMAVAELATSGARFIVPYARLRTSDVAVLAYYLVAS